MSRRTQLLVILLTVLAISSLTSHLIAWQFKFLTHLNPEPLKFNRDDAARGEVVAAGSSLTFYGIAWAEVGAALKMEVLGLAVPGGSVSEMEILQRRTPSARCTIIGISMYDANEYHVSEFRAQLVPFWEELGQLWSAHADWAHTKKVLSQYPLKYIHWLFPTAAKSIATMVKLRELLRALAHRQATSAPAEGAVVTDQDNGHLENITTWSAAHLQRSIADIRSHGGGQFEFHSTKRESLFRFLHTASAQGRAVVVVIPESPVYKKELVTPDVQRRFEEFITETQKRVPGVVWVRLDEVPELKSDKLYWDLIHLNAYGQATATKELLSKLAAAGIP